MIGNKYMNENSVKSPNKSLLFLAVNKIGKLKKLSKKFFNKEIDCAFQCSSQ